MDDKNEGVAWGNQNVTECCELRRGCPQKSCGAAVANFDHTVGASWNSFVPGGGGQRTTMLGACRVAARGFRAGAVLRAGASEAGSAGGVPSKLRLNMVVPHQILVKNEEVRQVTIPSPNGEFGVLAGHVPVVTELQPGVVTIEFGDGKDPVKYFVSGGFAFVHGNSTTDISAVEAVPLDELDPEAVKANLKEAEGSLAGAKDDKEKAVAQIAIDVNNKMALALGVVAS